MRCSNERYIQIESRNNVRESNKTIIYPKRITIFQLPGVKFLLSFPTMKISDNFWSTSTLQSIQFWTFSRVSESGGFIILFAFATLMGKLVTFVLRCARTSTLHPAETRKIMDDGDDGGAIFLPLWRRPSSRPLST